MKLIIDIPDKRYAELKKIENGSLACGKVLDAVKNGTPLPDGAEILTREAYTDLCWKASHRKGTRNEADN